MSIQVIVGGLQAASQIIAALTPLIEQVKAAGSETDRETLALELRKLRQAVDQQHERTQSKLRGNTADEAPS